MYHKTIYCKSYWSKRQNYTPLKYLLLAVEHLELQPLWVSQRKGRGEHYSYNKCTQNTNKKDPGMCLPTTKIEKTQKFHRIT